MMWHEPPFVLGEQGQHARLRVEGLAAGYGAFAVLRDLSLDVRPGLTVVLGPNGAGKTTLLKALSGLIPRSGKVLLDGEALPGKTDEIVRRGMALVPEGRQLFPQMTVTENLELGGWLMAKTRRAERLDQVPQAQATRLPAGRHHEWRRTTDGGSRPRHDGHAASADARRAVTGPGPEDGG